MFADDGMPASNGRPVDGPGTAGRRPAINYTACSYRFNFLAPTMHSIYQTLPCYFSTAQNAVCPVESTCIYSLHHSNLEPSCVPSNVDSNLRSAVAALRLEEVVPSSSLLTLFRGSSELRKDVRSLFFRLHQYLSTLRFCSDVLQH